MTVTSSRENKKPRKAAAKKAAAKTVEYVADDEITVPRDRRHASPWPPS